MSSSPPLLASAIDALGLPDGAVPLFIAPVLASRPGASQTYSHTSASSTLSSASASSSSSSFSSSAPPSTTAQTPPSKYVLFAYAEKFRPPHDKDSPIPYLVEKPLDSVPDALRQYLTPYPLRSTQPARRQPPPDLNAAAAAHARSAPPHTASRDPDASITSSFAFSEQNVTYPKHLKYMTIINSTKSGAQRSSDVYFAILVPILERFGFSHVYVATSSPQSIQNHAKSFTESSTVVILSGDTSVSEFVNCLEEQPQRRSRHLNLIVIPTGTGNALANSCGLTSVPQAISRMFLGELKPLANFQVEFPNGTAIVRPPTGNPAASASASSSGASASASSRVTSSSSSSSTSYSSSEAHSRATTSSSTTTVDNSIISSPVTTPELPYLTQFYSHKQNNDYFSPMVLHAIVVASWGVHASLVADSDSPEYRHLGEARFQKAAQENLARPQKYHGKATLGTPDSNDLEVQYINHFPEDSAQPTGAAKKYAAKRLALPYALAPDHAYLLFSVISKIEKTYTISPYSKPPSDLRLHLVHTDYTNNEDLLAMMMAPYDPRGDAHLDIGPSVQYYSLAYKDETAAAAAATAGPLAAEIYPEETQPNYQRWCLDGLVVRVPPNVGPVRVHLPTYSVRGWSLYVVV